MYEGAWEPVQYILPGIKLEEYQCRTALSVAYENQQLIMFETGLGKTLATVAGLQMRMNAKLSKKILWLSPLDTIKQTTSTFSQYTKMTDRVLTGTSQHLYDREDSSVDIYFINFEAFDNISILEWIYNKYRAFDTVVVDEAHYIANPFSSNRNGFIWWMICQITNRYILTATPVISKVDQYASLWCLMDKSLKNFMNYRAQIHTKKLLPELHPKIICYKQRNVTIPIEVICFEEHIDRTRLHGSALFKDTRCFPNARSDQILLELISKEKLNHFLIYSNIVDHHKPLKQLIESHTGRKVDILNGTTKQKSIVQGKFNKNEIDVLIYSVNVGIDLPADAVIFYEWDVYAAQSLGRAIRKESVPENFKAWFIINTLYESDMFENTVMKTGLLNEKALDKNLFKNIY